MTPETLIDEVQRRLDTFHSPSFDREIVEQLLALARRPAASAEPAVAVKALEWKGDFAHTAFGLFYSLDYQIGDVPRVLARHEGSMTSKSFWHTEDEAKAAAQADYEQRIRSALATQCGKTMVAEADLAAARSENDRLREGLREIANRAGGGIRASAIARALLAGKETGHG